MNDATNIIPQATDTEKDLIHAWCLEVKRRHDALKPIIDTADPRLVELVESWPYKITMERLLDRFDLTDAEDRRQILDVYSDRHVVRPVWPLAAPGWAVETTVEGSYPELQICHYGPVHAFGVAETRLEQHTTVFLDDYGPGAEFGDYKHYPARIVIISMKNFPELDANDAHCYALALEDAVDDLAVADEVRSA
ncbi:hypothetical protein ACFJGV_15050 [Cnuibacter sp. UC19_7]|uniref:hypothetical protein n=1 Tax=Cnuibacter sp. UC19_7 TaxID=3350166 RepID=UPI0036725A59